MKDISIKQFLINKGFTSSGQEITILQMVNLVNEWQGKGHLNSGTY
jgi:hypothetical protein